MKGPVTAEDVTWIIGGSTAPDRFLISDLA